MIILTKHCKERIKKRLLKKKSVDPCIIWSSAINFIKSSKRIESKKFIYYTDGRNTLVVTKNKIKGISREEAKRFIQDLEIDTFCVFFNNSVVKMSKKNLLKMIDLNDGNFIVSKHGDIFFGKAHVAITFRPSKRKERGWNINCLDY